MKSSFVLRSLTARALETALLTVLLATGVPSLSHAGPVTGANGSSGSDATAGGDGGDGANAPDSGGAGATAALGAPGLAGSNGTGGGGGGGGRDYSGGYPYGGAGGNSEFGTGGVGGTTVAPAAGGQEEAGGGGGYGGLASASNGGGGGGGGGRGATISTGIATILSTDPITGGSGGAGGVGYGGYGDGGGGGGGGIGVVFTGATSLTVNGTVTGGNGGNGGDAPGGGTFGGNGGAGGTGLRVTEPGATIWVNAAITGGDGGAVGQGNFTPVRSVPGAGGAGISGSGITVITTSSISGGFNGNGAVRADAITFIGGANALTLDTGWGLTGNIGVNGAGTTATFAQTTIDASVANIITGTGGVIVDDAGSGRVLTLSGINTYTGSTAVTSGKLVVDGSIASSSGVTVGDGGAIGGSGTVSNLVLDSGSKLAPGNSIGTLNAASATFNVGMAYEVEVNSAGASDLLNVSGVTTINGGKVVVVPFPDFAVNTTYTIVTSAGGVNGQFSDVESSIETAFRTAVLSYDLNNVYLTINQIAFADVALTTNQKAAASAAESLGAGNAVYQAIIALTDVEAARGAFDALSGEVHASVQGVLIEDSRYVRDAVFGRLLQASYATGGASQTALASNAPLTAGRMALGATDKSARDLPANNNLAFWAQGYGAWGNIDGNGNAAGVDRTLGGFVSGVDAGLGGGWRAGIATGYARSSLDVDARLSSGSIDSYHLIGYLGGKLGAFALRGGGAWTWSNVETSRTIAFPGFVDRTEASYDGDTGQLFGELALPLSQGTAAWEPFARVSYVQVDTGGFTEAGGAAALAGAGADESLGYSTLGVRVTTTMRAAGLLLTPHASLAWQHAIGDIDPAQTLAFASGSAAFTVLGAPLARDSAIIDAGLAVTVAPNATLGFAYSGQVANQVTDNAVTGRFDLRF